MLINAFALLSNGSIRWGLYSYNKEFQIILFL